MSKYLLPIIFLFLLNSKLAFALIEKREWVKKCKYSNESTRFTCKTIRDKVIGRGSSSKWEDVYESLIKKNKLNLSFSQVSDLSPLSGLTNLKHLHLYMNQIKNVSHLAHLNQLESLHLDNNPLTDIEPLTNLLNLRELSLSNNQLSDFSPITNLINLNSLSLDNTKIPNLLPLKNLHQLESLQLDRCGITDLSLLSRLRRLKRLSLHKNYIEDISPLKKLKKLQQLCLSSNEISELSPLAGLTKLRSLSLEQNHIDDLRPLSELSSLNILNLENNPIADYKPLLGPSQLHKLPVEAKDNSGSNNLEFLKFHKRHELFSNKPSNLEPIMSSVFTEKRTAIYKKVVNLANPHFDFLGSKGGDCDILMEPKKRIMAKIAKLREHQAAYIKRTDGSWTYATVKERKVGGLEYLLFKVNKRGSTKKIERHQWAKFIRPIKDETCGF